MLMSSLPSFFFQYIVSPLCLLGARLSSFSCPDFWDHLLHSLGRVQRILQGWLPRYLFLYSSSYCWVWFLASFLFFWIIACFLFLSFCLLLIIASYCELQEGHNSFKCSNNHALNFVFLWKHKIKCVGILTFEQYLVIFLLIFLLVGMQITAKMIIFFNIFDKQKFLI